MTIPVPSNGDIITDPEWLTHRYDANRNSFHMVRVARERHRQIPFLTDEYLGADLQPREVNRTDVKDHAAAPAPLHFIFHSAFCCSTLLVAAFDIPGVAMGLKEPMLFNDISGWHHRGATGAQVARLLDEAMTLLARPFGPGEAVIIKPSNIANPLIPAIMALRPDARALLIHAPLPDFLASITRKGMWGRLWVRDLLQKLLQNGVVNLGIAPDDYLGLTDIQVAAVGWLAQHMLFQRLTQQFGERMATVDSETFLASPEVGLFHLAQHFGLQVDKAMASAIVAGPVFARDSKTGASFSNGQRADAARHGMSLHADEIDKVLTWADRIADNIGLSYRLPRSLFD
ncbi:hypothetical protein [Sphingobium sp. MK2]|uniref:hypothetical protein n=1 Tax=Sphingobium sp. MK2 TaxID=3116540 RepID=UPI0032E35A5D